MVPTKFFLVFLRINSWRVLLYYVAARNLYPKITSKVTFLKSPLSPVFMGESGEKSHVTNHILLRENAGNGMSGDETGMLLR